MICPDDLFLTGFMDAMNLYPTQNLCDFSIFTLPIPYCAPKSLSQDLTHSKRCKNHLLFQGTFDILEGRRKESKLVLVVKGPTGKRFPLLPKVLDF